MDFIGDNDDQGNKGLLKMRTLVLTCKACILQGEYGLDGLMESGWERWFFVL